MYVCICLFVFVLKSGEHGVGFESEGSCESKADNISESAANVSESGLSTASSSDHDFESGASESSGRDSNEDEALLFDADHDEVLLHAGADFTTADLAEVLNELQRANNQSGLGMKHIHSVIKALLPMADPELPSLSQLRQVLIRNAPRVRRIHACSQDCILFIGEHTNLKRCPKCRRLRYYQDTSCFSGHSDY